MLEDGRGFSKERGAAGVLNAANGSAGYAAGVGYDDGSGASAIEDMVVTHCPRAENFRKQRLLHRSLRG